MSFLVREAGLEAVLCNPFSFDRLAETGVLPRFDDHLATSIPKNCNCNLCYFHHSSRVINQGSDLPGSFLRHRGKNMAAYV